MVASNDRFWAKVLFREYIRHYRKMTDEQIVNDVRQSMDDLEELVEDSPTFGSKMVKWSMQRQQEPPAIASRENGKQGGRPRKNSKSTASGNDQTAGDASASDQEEETANVSGDALSEGGENGNASLDVHSGSDSAALESETPYADVSGSCKPDDAKPEKRRYGKYRHVLLTDDEGRKLRESLGEDLEDAVAILDEYIQSLPVKAKGAKKNGAKWWMQEYEAKDHYIILHHGWARKRLNEMRTEELNARAAELRCSAAETNAKAAEKRLENANSSSQPRQMYLTSDDISRRNAENGWRQLQLMHQMEGNG